MNYFFERGKGINLDITHRCPLECLRCGRQAWRKKGYPVPGTDMSFSDFDKITNYFPSISFCGQYSDPIHHPQFLDFLKLCAKKNTDVEVHVASSFKSKKFYIDAFKAAPKAKWVFGIDGLPKDSHKYRINQDGQKLYNIMLESKQYLVNKPSWQYIVFSFNEHDIDTALEMAKKDDVNFLMINSSRWWTDDDWLKPKTKR